MLPFYYLLALSFVFSHVNGAATLVACKLEDPTLDECFARSLEANIKTLKNGDPDYGLKSVDPMFISEITVDAGKSVSLVQHYTNVTILGLSTGKIGKLHYDPAKKTLTFDAFLTKLQQLGHYQVDGEMLSLRIYGSGNSSITFTDATLTLNVQFSEYTKNGEIHYKVTELLIDTAPKKIVFAFDDLFDGTNKLLSDNIINVMNVNWEVLYADVRPVLNNNYARIYKRYLNSFLKNVPINKLVN